VGKVEKSRNLDINLIEISHTPECDKMRGPIHKEGSLNFYHEEGWNRLYLPHPSFDDVKGWLHVKLFAYVKSFQ
jgi:hypothetical protein